MHTIVRIRNNLLRIRMFDKFTITVDCSQSKDKQRKRY